MGEMRISGIQRKFFRELRCWMMGKLDNHPPCCWVRQSFQIAGIHVPLGISIPLLKAVQLCRPQAKLECHDRCNISV